MFFKSSNDKYGIALMNEIGKTFGFIQKEFPSSKNPMSNQEAFELFVLLHFISEYSLYKFIVTKDKVTNDLESQNKILNSIIMPVGDKVRDELISFLLDSEDFTGEKKEYRPVHFVNYQDIVRADSGFAQLYDKSISVIEKGENVSLELMIKGMEKVTSMMFIVNLSNKAKIEIHKHLAHLSWNMWYVAVNKKPNPNYSLEGF